jgi:hypothetical protein
MEIADFEQEQREATHEEEDDEVVERPSGSPHHLGLPSSAKHPDLASDEGQEARRSASGWIRRGG